MQKHSILLNLFTVFLSILFGMYSINASAGICGLIPGNNPLYSGSEIELKKDISINGTVVNSGNYKPNAAIETDGTVSTGQSLTLSDLDPKTFPTNPSTIDLKSNTSFIVNSATAIFYDDLKLEKENTSMIFSGGGPFHIDKLEAKKDNSTINFSAGTYYINDLILKGDNSVINITSEPVILHIGNKFEVDGKDININLNGNVDGLVVYLHSNSEFKVKEKNLNFTGLIYGPNIKGVKFEKENVTFHGAIIVSGDKIKIEGRNFTLSYTASDQAAINALSTCTIQAPILPTSTWHMDESVWNNIANEVVDNTLNGHHGTAQNGATTLQLDPAIPGDPGSCGFGHFDGNDDYVALPSIPNLTGSFTLTAWVKSTKSTRGRIFSDDDNNQGGYALSLNEPSSGKLRFYSRNINPVILDTSAVVIPQNNKWYFVSAVHDVTTKQRFIYIDGNLKASGTYTGTWGSDSGIASIGSETNASAEGVGFAPFGGNIDEMQIFESALTQSQIQTVMAQTHACPPINNLHHFELSYSANALTCTPALVTIKACTIADCSALFTSDVTVTLSPATGWPTNPVTITNGTATLALEHTTAESVILDVLSSTITPTDPLQCFSGAANDPTCSINFADSGFVFDVPTLTACKPSADVTIRAVKKSTTSVQCVSALAGSQSVNFWSTYVNPNSGTQPVQISGTSISNSSLGTPVNLTFDINGEAKFTAQYDDSGQLQLDAEYTGANNLVLAGNDLFVSKPVMLAVYSNDSNAACVSADASCSKFKKAGETFNLKVNAACWTSDTDTDFTDNPVTPNFELAGIANNHTLLAPAGSSGILDVASFNFTKSDNGSHTINQAVSEVGVFNFSVMPPNYFGETLSTAISPAIGRFYPDHFQVSTVTAGAFGANACTGFSYSGQPFTYQNKPQLKVTAYNAASTPIITQNYTSGFAKLSLADFNVASPTTDANQLGSNGVSLVRLVRIPDTTTLTDNTDGSLTFSFGNDSYTYLHETNSRIGPFNNAVNLTFSSITDSDSVQAQALPYTLQPSDEPIRFGRLNISNAHGSELAPLPVDITTEYFNGINWVDNTADQCTTLNSISHLRLANPDTSSGSWQAGNTTMNIGSGTSSGVLTNNSPLLNGVTTLTFSAPGEDNQGYIDIQSRISANYDWLLGDYDNNGSYDDEASGRASFGLFKGSDNIIFRREVY